MRKFILVYTKYESFANFPYEEYPIPFDDEREAFKFADKHFPCPEYKRVLWEIEDEGDE